MDSPSLKGQPEAGISTAPMVEFPVIHFSSGTDGRPASQEFMRAFNARDHEQAKSILAERGEEIPEFQRRMLSWVLAILEGDPAALTWRQAAERYASGKVQNAAIFENYAFMALRAGDWAEAKELCKKGIAVCPTVEGLWVNLLVAMDRQGEEDAINLILMKLPKLFNIKAGLLWLYIVNDPAFRTAVCNGG